jgi:transmembrane sensor
MARRTHLWARVKSVLPGGGRRAREEALTWLARLERGLRAREGPELLAWLRRPAHRALITKAAAEWHGPDVLAVLAAIFPLDPRLLEARDGRRSLVRAAIAVVCAVGAATPLVLANRYMPGVLSHTHSPGENDFIESVGHTYAAGPAATRRIALADGTRVELNRGARIVVAYSEHVRAVLVSRGEAIFAVAREPHRSFHVHAAGRDFDAPASTFDLRVTAPHRMDLLVLEGAVTAFPALARPHAPVLVSALQRLTIDADGERGSALSWQELRTQLAWRPAR